MSPGASGSAGSSGKPLFKAGEPDRTEKVFLDRGDFFGVVASSHGDSLAYAEMIGRMESLGARTFFHCGDITGEASDPTGCVGMAWSKNSYAVAGNHDVLAVGTEYVHDYDPAVERFAVHTEHDMSAEARQRLATAAAKIETPFFSIVHESVMPPYYAKRSKRRRRSHGWDVGSASDENTTAVCYSRIDKPHFIGSEHAAYIISAKDSLNMSRPRPGEEVVLPQRSVISVPSISFSRDKDYDCGGIFCEILEDGKIRACFLSLHPAARIPVYSNA